MVLSLGGQKERDITYPDGESKKLRDEYDRQQGSKK